MGKRKKKSKKNQKVEVQDKHFSDIKSFTYVTNKSYTFDILKEIFSKVWNFVVTHLWLSIIAPTIVGILLCGIKIIIEKNESSQFFLSSHFHEYTGGYVDKEFIPIYHSNDEYYTLLELSVANGNEIAVDIKNIIIEVTDYKSIDEFVVEKPAGGANMKDILSWICNISPEKKEYYSLFVGANGNNTEDISRSKYIEISPHDTGEFAVKILTDMPGLYEIETLIEYTYKGRIERKESEKNKFIYDPNCEVKYDNE